MTLWPKTYGSVSVRLYNHFGALKFKVRSLETWISGSASILTRVRSSIVWLAWQGRFELIHGNLDGFLVVLGDCCESISPTSNDDSLVQRHSLTRVGLCNYRHWAQGAQLLERLDHRRICCRDALLKICSTNPAGWAGSQWQWRKKARDREDDSLSNREWLIFKSHWRIGIWEKNIQMRSVILLSHTILPDTTWYDVDKTSHIPAEDLPDAFSSSRRFASNWSRARLTASQGGKNNDRIGFSDRIGWAAGRQAVFTNNNSDPDPDPNYHFIVVFSVFESLSLCSTTTYYKCTPSSARTRTLNYQPRTPDYEKKIRTVQPFGHSISQTIVTRDYVTCVTVTVTEQMWPF